MSQINKDILKTLQEIKFWIRLLAWEELKKMLERVLDSEEKKIAYILSDGKNTSTLVATRAGTSQSSISRWWQEWKAMGIAVDVSARGGGRAKTVTSLEDMGIEIPTVFSRKEADVNE